MKPLSCFLILIGLSIAAQAHEVNSERIVNYCNAILLQDAYGPGISTGSPASVVVSRFSSKAHHYFATRSFAQKKRELQQVARLPLSQGAMRSVAYVSAVSGIKPYENTRRMLGYIATADSLHPLYPQMEGLGEDIYGNIWKIYERFPDRRIALLLLCEHSDGAGAEVVRSVRFGLLQQHPRFILGLALQSKQAFALLSEDFSTEAGEEEFRVLRRLCHDRDPILRRGARQIRHAVHVYHSLYKLPYYMGS